MRKINLTDVTIRESVKDKNITLSFKEKVEMARIMDRVNYSTIELPEIDDFRTDSLLIKTMATSVKDNKISCPVGLCVENVEKVWDCMKHAKRPVLTVAVPTSVVQMEYICGKKPPMILELIENLVSEAKKYCKDVEFSAVDATRADPDFLNSCIDKALDAGANKITICDNAAEYMPSEFREFIENIIEKHKDKFDKNDAYLAVEISNDLNMASACAYAAIKGGASEIKTTVRGFDYPRIEDVVKLISKKGQDIGVRSTIHMTELVREIDKILWIINEEKTILQTANSVEQNASSDISLNIHDDIDTVSAATEKIGYELSYEDKVNVYEAFIRVARKKERVTAKELEAIIASSALSVPAVYKIESYVINSGNVITATANIKLERDGEALEGISTGDGPIDAAFKAIEKILGHHYELDDFQIQSVTEGREAMGSALVKLRSMSGKLYSGNGISTDIIGASIRAYVSAINKIAYEEV